MDNLYSLFYTGQQNPYGIGAWDSRSRKLKHSSSQPFLNINNKTLPRILTENIRKNTQSSNNSQNIKLPLIHSRPESLHRHRKSGKRYRTRSSSHSSNDYDVDKNRNELSNYVKDINNSIALRLQNDNFVAQQKLNNIKHNYNEIKTLLNNKIEKLEQDQQMQFDNLKYALEQGGNLKMMGAVKNANGGNNYDLRRAEEEDMIDATRKLPRLLEDKINIINNMKRKEKQDEKRLLSQVKRKVNEEIQKQKEKDEQRFKKEIDEIEQKRENIRRERRRLMEELQRNDIEESESNTMYSNQQNLPMQAMPGMVGMPGMQGMPGMYPPQMMPQYPYPPSIYPPPMNNNNSSNNNDSTSEFLKIFLLKKLFDDKPQVVQQTPQVPQFIPYPQPQMSPQIQYQPQPMPQQPISYPQPIIYQNPPQVMNPPNVIIQQERRQPQIVQQQPNVQYKDLVITKSETLNSEKGIPFIDPLEEYLEETKSRRTKTKSSKSRSRTKTKSKSSSKKSSKHKKSKKKKTKESKKEEEDEEEESTPPPIKLKLVDPDNKDSKVVYPKDKKKESKTKKTKDSQKDKKKDSKRKKTNKKKKKEEEEEEFDEEEEEEEDDEEFEEEDEEEEEEDDEPQKGKDKKK